jgi:uncharacterized membrane protein YfcA
MFIITGLLILIVAFAAEYVDSSLGMGYGTTLTPILLLMGYTPLEVVPVILFSELLTGASAAYLHHRSGNVHFDFRRDDESRMAKRLGKLGYAPKSKDSKIALILSVCSVVSTVIAVVIAIKLPSFYLSLYIGLLVLIMGVIIVLRRKKRFKFSVKKILGIGLVASFNKGMSGGGYGPLVTSGQVLSGLKSKSAVAITSFAESLTCLVGVISYIAIGAGATIIGWEMAPFLIAGALLSVPFSVYTVKRMKTKKLTLIIGVSTIALGSFTLIKLFL